MNHKEDLIAGRNAVIEALRAKKPIGQNFCIGWMSGWTDPYDRKRGKENRCDS